jgi:hypothetical protein
MTGNDDIEALDVGSAGRGQPPKAAARWPALRSHRKFLTSKPSISQAPLACFPPAEARDVRRLRMLMELRSPFEFVDW